VKLLNSRGLQKHLVGEYKNICMPKPRNLFKNAAFSYICAPLLKSRKSIFQKTKPATGAGINKTGQNKWKKIL
jgi:hypothetical protein